MADDVSEPSPHVYTEDLLGKVNDFAIQLHLLIDEQNPYERLEPFVRNFILSHTGEHLKDSKIYFGDRNDIGSTMQHDGAPYYLNLPSRDNVPNGLMTEDVRDALLELLEALPPFCVQGKAPRRRRELIEGLGNQSADYLYLSGLLQADGAGEDGAGEKSGEADGQKPETVTAESEAVRADTKVFSGKLPDDHDAQRLDAMLLVELPKGEKSQNKIALEIAGDEISAQTLLKSLRRCEGMVPYLRSITKSADK